MWQAVRDGEHLFGATLRQSMFKTGCLKADVRGTQL